MFDLRRLQIGLIATTMLVLTLPARAAEVDKYLPEDTQIVLVVNTQQLLDAPLVKKHFLQALRELIKASDDVAKDLESLGFDPLKDLTSITGAISSTGNEAKGLVILHGRFDKAKFKAKGEEAARLFF